MLNYKRIISGLILLASALAAYSQEADDETAKRALEREIKTSGLYLYGEAVGNTKNEAVDMAKAALTSEINKEIINNPEWQHAKSIQAKDLEYNIDNIDLPRGNKVRVITYIKKENIQVIFDNKSPDIQLADKKEEKKSKKEEKKAVAEEKKEAVEEKKEEVTVTEQTAAVNTGENQPSGVLESILKAGSAQQVNKILLENKNKGKVAYGRMETLTDPANAYLLVYKRTGELVSVFDKGTGNPRKDLLSGEEKPTAVETGNQVIWFQIYND